MFVQSKGGAQLVRGILQLLEEWEYHFALAGVAHHSVKAMLAKNIDGPSTNRDHTATGEDGSKQQEQVWTMMKMLPGVLYSKSTIGSVVGIVCCDFKVWWRQCCKDVLLCLLLLLQLLKSFL